MRLIIWQKCRAVRRNHRNARWIDWHRIIKRIIGPLARKRTDKAGITTIEHSTKWLATHLITSCSSSITYVITPTRTLSLETSKGYARHEQMPLIRRMHSLPLPTNFRLIEKHSWHDRLESLDRRIHQWYVKSYNNIIANRGRRWWRHH